MGYIDSKIQNYVSQCMNNLFTGDDYRPELELNHQGRQSISHLDKIASQTLPKLQFTIQKAQEIFYSIIPMIIRFEGKSGPHKNEYIDNDRINELFRLCSLIASSQNTDIVSVHS